MIYFGITTLVVWYHHGATCSDNGVVGIEAAVVVDTAGSGGGLVSFVQFVQLTTIEQFVQVTIQTRNANYMKKTDQYIRLFIIYTFHWFIYFCRIFVIEQIIVYVLKRDYIYNVSLPCVQHFNLRRKYLHYKVVTCR